MSEYYVVLLDTVSIQKYIFQSNKLKENLGASFLVEEIYKSYLQIAINKVIANVDVNFWKSNPDKIQKNFDIGYIGGGNALLLFEKKSQAEEFIKEWTKLLLIHTPGIITAVALDTLNLDNFTDDKIMLFKTLGKNKSQYIPNTIIPRHGITTECNRSGLSADVWNDIIKEHVSSCTHAKIEASENARDKIHRKYSDILNNEYCFTDQLEKLGQLKGEDSHIAIVHIDGNSMGERFKATRSLKELRNLSITVDNATKEAFGDLLKHILSNYEKIMSSFGFDDSSKDRGLKYPIDKQSKKKILPIRPIILGGDDVTFVCDGKLGIYLAKLFIEFFEKKKVSDGQKLTACAGISVIKTKYPFYRGCRLSEELCHNAKRVRRSQKVSNSFIDFHISTGGLAGTLTEIRKKYFDVPQGNILFRPYKLTIQNTDEKSFKLFVKNTAELRSLPRNKVHELREVLTLSGEATKQFIQEIKYRGRNIPKIPGRSYELSLFEHGKTPYFDMIELMEFYPEFEFDPNGGNE